MLKQNELFSKKNKRNIIIFVVACVLIVLAFRSMGNVFTKIMYLGDPTANMTFEEEKAYFLEKYQNAPTICSDDYSLQNENYDLLGQPCVRLSNLGQRGQKTVQMYGEVIQLISTDERKAELLVLLGKRDEMDFDSIIYVEYRYKDDDKQLTSALENKTISLYGYVDGTTSYTTMQDTSKTVYHMYAEYCSRASNTEAFFGR